MTDPVAEKAEKLAGAIESEIKAELRQPVGMRAIKRTISCLAIACLVMFAVLWGLELENDPLAKSFFASAVALFVTRLLLAIPFRSLGKSLIDHCREE